MLILGYTRSLGTFISACSMFENVCRCKMRVFQEPNKMCTISLDTASLANELRLDALFSLTGLSPILKTKQGQLVSFTLQSNSAKLD